MNDGKSVTDKAIGPQLEAVEVEEHELEDVAGGTSSLWSGKKNGQVGIPHPPKADHSGYRPSGHHHS